jgi:hypothetical protein
MNEGTRPVIIPYTSEDGSIKLDVKIEDGTVWLTQEEMADLFGVGRSAITKHIRNIYEISELDPSTTSAKMAQVVQNRPGYRVIVYNLDMVITVGYRVNSTIAITFRKWATQLLKEYMVKGFVMDDKRLSMAGTGFAGTDYFDELLERVRKIRTSESMFYQKVKSVFSATSRDYDPKSAVAQEFYQTIQNKFHYAVTGKTAAELVTARVSAKQKNAGLTHFDGKQPSLADAKIAKNYLLEDELRRLYLISEQFLSFAELTVESRKTMTMAQWTKRLDDMLSLNELGVLTSKGSVSHTQMEKKVKEELAKYKAAHKLVAGKRTSKKST